MSGETFLYLGRQYRLKLERGRAAQERGDAAYIGIDTASHRNHQRGVWSGASLLEQVRLNLGCHACFLAHLRPSTVARIRPAILRHQYRLARRYERKGDLAVAREILSWLRLHARGRGVVPAPDVWMRSARVAMKRWLAGSG